MVSAGTKQSEHMYRKDGAFIVTERRGRRPAHHIKSGREPPCFSFPMPAWRRGIVNALVVQLEPWLFLERRSCLVIIFELQFLLLVVISDKCSIQQFSGRALVRLRRNLCGRFGCSCGRI
jgi:hypothetical protein